ncbi:PUA-like domain-containing protein [Suillus placidus]|uniref:PUA-like domain-containing protein n=1 Tax=Suillus placidus TaxID=48579 RepID=A0A9P7A3A1_9AGAM|nr:PUA-like domain-containing protein [Suillus placidus]
MKTEALSKITAFELRRSILVIYAYVLLISIVLTITSREIPGAPVGTTWKTRLSVHSRECFDAGVHQQIEAGISGTETDGAFSIVVSGQYKDDKDNGDTISYTGSGGHKPGDRTREQVRDQEWTDFGNEALRKSSKTGKPVRVIRGYEFDSEFAPWEGFRYDGLYICKSAWKEKNSDGYYDICRYKMEASLPNDQASIRLTSVKRGFQANHPYIVVQRLLAVTSHYQMIMPHHWDCRSPAELACKCGMREVLLRIPPKPKLTEIQGKEMKDSYDRWPLRYSTPITIATDNKARDQPITMYFAFGENENGGNLKVTCQWYLSRVRLVMSYYKRIREYCPWTQQTPKATTIEMAWVHEVLNYLIITVDGPRSSTENAALISHHNGGIASCVPSLAPPVSS